MKSSIARVLALVFMLGIWGTAAADSVRIVWICTVNDGKTMDDVRAANSAWVKYHKANADDAITSTILTPMIGNTEPGRFIFADDFPSLEAWNASMELSDTDEGAAIDAALADAVTCPQNSMHSAEES